MERINICKKMYETLYSQIGQNLSLTINNLSADKTEEIN